MKVRRSWKLPAAPDLPASTIRGAPLGVENVQVHSRSARLQAMDLGGVELFSGAATSPSKDQVDDDEEGYMMDIEDDLDKMEDAFEMVQHQKSAGDA